VIRRYSDAQRLLNLSSYYRTEGYIKLTVGPNKVSWILNKELVWDRIPALRKNIAIPSSMHDRRMTETLGLEDYDPKIFAFMIDWVLTGKLDFPLHHDSGDHREDLELWCGMYDYSHELEMDQLSQDVLDQIKVCLRCCKSPEAIARLFEKTPIEMQQMISQEILDEFDNATEEKVNNEVAKWAEVINSHPRLLMQFISGVKRHRAIHDGRKVDVRKRKSGHSSQPSQERLQRRALGNLGVPKVINLDSSERSRSGDSAL